MAISTLWAGIRYLVQFGHNAIPSNAIFSTGLKLAPRLAPGLHKSHRQRVTLRLCWASEVIVLHTYHPRLARFRSRSTSPKDARISVMMCWLYYSVAVFTCAKLSLDYQFVDHPA